MFYTFEVTKTDGGNIKLDQYKEKVILIVNTATKCGLSTQFEALESLYRKYHHLGFDILSFPCDQFLNQEPYESSEIPQICRVKYGVTFPVFRKLKVKGKSAHPLFHYLVNESKGLFTNTIKWNFTKFLIDKKGRVMGRYAPSTSPFKIEKEIRALLEKVE